jgi:hypothetical protein
MKAPAHFFIAGSFCLIMSACRDIQPVRVTDSVSGYNLHGTVTTLSGIPLDSVTVILYYNYSYVGSTPLDTTEVTVPDTVTFVNVSVYTVANILVRTLYSDYMPHEGVVQRFQWNGLDMEDSAVPSGMYRIRYTVGGTIVKNTPYIIDGHPTTVTDSAGQFTITSANLPIGQQFDASTPSIPSVGVYQITSQITVQFLKNNIRSSYTSLVLTPDEVNYHAFTF